jgi:hypothetical protein
MKKIGVMMNKNSGRNLPPLDELERKSGFTMSMDGRTVMERIRKA